MGRSDMTDIDVSQVEPFRAWLRSRGRSIGTATLYGEDVLAAATRGGFEVRIADRTLAPKTRRRIRTAFRQWARFVQDHELEKTLEAFNLPPAKRVTPKIPLARALLLDLVDAIDRAETLDPVNRAVLGMMACRGFRIGDCLRMKREEIVRGLETGVLVYEAKRGSYLSFPLNEGYRRHVEAIAAIRGSWERVHHLIIDISKTSEEVRMKSAERSVARSLTKVGATIGLAGLYPHRLRRTYAVEYLKTLKGVEDAVQKLQQHMQWESLATAMEYIDHARGAELETAAAKIFDRERKDD